MYELHNICHSVEARDRRRADCARGGGKLFVGKTQLRLLPDRPQQVSDAFFIDNHAELCRLSREGRLLVRHPDGRKVDMDTGEPVGPVQVPRKPTTWEALELQKRLADLDRQHLETPQAAPVIDPEVSLESVLAAGMGIELEEAEAPVEPVPEPETTPRGRRRGKKG